MTRDEIMKMAAGPEMDKAVVRLMGWKFLLTSRNGKVEHWEDGDGDWFGVGESRLTRLWSPSTDIAAAWEVVEKVRTLGFEWSFDSNGGSGGVFRWRAIVWVDDLSPDFKARDAEMPLAICRAALLAVTHEPEPAHDRR
jgi:hypothetical protein